jgi:hypothetical protein
MSAQGEVEQTLSFTICGRPKTGHPLLQAGSPINWLKKHRHFVKTTVFAAMIIQRGPLTLSATLALGFSAA